MAYIKKQFKRLKKFVKKRYVRPGGVARLVKDVAYLKTAINAEKKYYDIVHVSSTSTITDTAPAIINPWNDLTKGLDENQRIGDQIKALKTWFRFGLECNSGDLTAAVSSFVRIFVIMDTEARSGTNHSAIPLRDAILADTTTGQLQVRSPYRVTNNNTGALSGVPGNRYKILRDFKVTIDNVNKKQKDIKICIDHTKSKYKGIRVKYNDSDLNPEAVDHCLYCLVITDNPAATATIQMSGVTSRVQYVDN